MRYKEVAGPIIQVHMLPVLILNIRAMLLALEMVWS